MPSAVNQLHSTVGEVFKDLGPARVLSYVANEATVRPLLETPETLEGGPSMFPVFKEFVRRPMGSKNMWEFLMLKSFGGRIGIHKEFLEKNQSDSEEKGGKLGEKPVKRASPALMYSPKLLDESIALETQVREKIVALYQLGYSSWRPDLGVAGLIEAIKEEGPLGINGLFGSVSYIDAPFEMQQKIQNKAVYAWRP